MLNFKQQTEIMTVDEVTDKIRLAVCSVPELREMAVRGELQGFKRHSSGHVYFTLLGENARISCVIWRSQAASILTWPKDGDEVLVRGRLDVYGAYGAYQIYAATLLPLGAGAKARARAMLQQKLEKEGLFDPRNKRAFPRYPKHVAIITSPTGAALQDVLRIASQRWPLAKLTVVSSLMQGLSAASEITAAFSKVARLDGLCAVMLVRGGGSRDDLDVFDEEEVVRAVRACPVPVVTGLGHQIDSTLCDLASDAEAPTPSGAAEFLFPDKYEVLSMLEGVEENLCSVVARRLDGYFAEVESIKERFAYSITNGYLTPLNEKLNASYNLLQERMKRALDAAENCVARLAAGFEAASPLNILAKGYALCYNAQGKNIHLAKDIARGEDLKIKFYDGEVDATVR